MRSRHSVAWQSWKLINFSFSNKKTCSLLSAEARCTIVTKVGHVRVCDGNHEVTGTQLCDKFENSSIFRFQTKNLNCRSCTYRTVGCQDPIGTLECARNKPISYSSKKNLRMGRMKHHVCFVLRVVFTCSIKLAIDRIPGGPMTFQWKYILNTGRSHGVISRSFNQSLVWIPGGPTAFSPEVSIKV